ncbi:putative N-acetyltransferase san [Lachnellula arida]|uniref:Putative N-acetyltransferase san n=1 Tax=Lachnellula arida TaxID=1316785 RepID=A0A8T9B787_9HELO|nr:putative N-acetyltransferase san [Lachnellula arida]
MDTNGTSPVPQSRMQPSIRSFFQPRSPNYAPPPGTSTRQPQPQPQPLRSTSQIPASLSPAPPPPPPPTPTPALPPQATISQVTEHHIQPLRRINSLLLPIPYPDSFYASILTAPPPSTPSFSRTITWSDSSSPSLTSTTAPKVIGGIICRLEPCPDSPSPPTHQIYIQSLALLSPYRSKGLATAILKDIISSAVLQTESESENGSGSAILRIESVYAHVWTQNQEGLEWYAKRGFHREENVLVGYYRKLKPDTAFVLRRRISASDYLNSLPPVLLPSPLAPRLANANAEVETEAKVEIEMNGNAKAKRPDGLVHARSFQDRGPEREWNDLPEDVLGSANGSGFLKPKVDDGSAASSRSSSRSGKKKRVYPAAAFGS